MTTNSEALAASQLVTAYLTTLQGGGSPGPTGSTQPPTPVCDCGSGFSATKMIAASFPIPGGTANRYFTDMTTVNCIIAGNGARDGFMCNDAIVVDFVAPAAGDKSLSLQMFQTNSPTGMSALRTVTLSTQPCDWAVPASANALYASNTVQTAVLSLRTDGVTSWGWINLVPGQTYYLNVMNFVNGQNMCTSGRCDVFFSFTNAR